MTLLEYNRGFKAGFSGSKQEAEPQGSLQRTAVNKQPRWALQHQPYKQEVLMRICSVETEIQCFEVKNKPLSHWTAFTLIDLPSSTLFM